MYYYCIMNIFLSTLCYVTHEEQERLRRIFNGKDKGRRGVLSVVDMAGGENPDPIARSSILYIYIYIYICIQTYIL